MDWDYINILEFIRFIEQQSFVNIKKTNNIYIINEFFEQLYIIESFLLFKELYFEIKLDERGRQYKVGYPLNFMSNKLIRYNDFKTY